VVEQVRHDDEGERAQAGCQEILAPGEVLTMIDCTPKTTLELVLCETEQDAAAIRAAGRRSVRVVKSAEQLYIARQDGSSELDPTLGAFGSFVLAYAADAGQLRDDIAMRLGDIRCKWVDFTDDAPNPAALGEAGESLLSNALATARRMWTDEICTIDDVPEPGPQAVYETGIRGLDDHGLRLVRPAFMPVIGPYGSGKSVLLRQLAVNLWKLHGWRTLITSFEEKIKPRIQRDLRRHLIAKPMEEWTETDVVHADGAIRDGFRFMRRPRGAAMNMERVIDRIEYAVKVYGVDVVIIDPVNELDHEVPKHQNKTDYIGRFIMGLKALADDYNLLMIVAAHPPKDGVEKRLAKGKLLTLNDGADSAHWGNKADIGWAVWRPAMDGPTLLHVDKVKDHETMGRPTLAELVMDEGMNRFRVRRLGYDILGEEAAS
jgi:twinkle protein